MKKLFLVILILLIPSITSATIYDDEGNVIIPGISTKAVTCPSGQFFSAIDANGVPLCSTPAGGGGGGSMTYPGTGIALSTGTGWAGSIANNSANWNTAYQYRITTCNAPLTCASNILSINTSANWPGSAGSLASAYIDWSAASGGSMILNKPTLPQNTSSTTSQYFTAYNATTGAYTKAQPQWSDIGGTTPTWNQNTTGTAAGLSATLATGYGGTGVTDFSFSGAAHKVASVSGSPADGCATWTSGQLLSSGSSCGSSGISLTTRSIIP